MTTNFPSGLDAFTNPSATDAMDSVTVPHATQHADLNDAVEALQAKVGVDGSAVTTSLDYKLADLGTWTSWTPTIYPQSGSLTSYVAYGWYTQINDLVIIQFNIGITNTGTAGGACYLNLPVTPTSNTLAGAKGSIAEMNVAGFQGVIFHVGGSNTAFPILAYNWTSPFGNGRSISGFAVYEV